MLRTGVVEIELQNWPWPVRVRQRSEVIVRDSEAGRGRAVHVEDVRRGQWIRCIIGEVWRRVLRVRQM